MLWVLLALTGAALGALTLIPALLPVRPLLLARLVEARFPDLRDGLLAVVAPAGGLPSPDLSRALAHRVATRLSGKTLWPALELGGLRRLALACLPCLLTAALVVVTCPEGLARLLSPPTPAVRQPEARATQKAPPVRTERLGVFDLSLTVRPPAYTQMSRRVVTSDFEIVRVIKGSGVELSGRHSPGAVAELMIGHSKPARVSSAQARIAHAFTALRDTSWRLALSRDDESVSLGPYRIIVQADRRPRVEIIRPGRDITLSAAGPIGLQVIARDDFGLGRVSLLYRKRGAGQWQSTLLEGGGKMLDASFEWDLSPMRLKPGEAVEYRAMAADNDTVSGPKTAVSKTYTVAIPQTAPEPVTPLAVEQAQQVEQDALEALKQQARAFDEQLKQLIDQARDAEAAGETGAMPRAALQEAQQRLQDHADAARRSMAQTERSLSDNPLVTGDMLQKVQELHRLMAELMDEDMKKVMQKVQQAMGELTPRDLSLTLEQAREAQQRFMQKLDRTIELLRKARLEAQLMALKEFVSRLADEQEELMARTEKLTDGTQSSREMRQQEQLADSAAPLAQQVRGLSEKMARQDQQIASDLRNLAADLEQADPAGAMRSAAARMHEQRASRAGGHQQKALQALRDAAARLAGAAADLTAQQRRALTGAARRLTANALKLSAGQEDAREGLSSMLAQGVADVLGQKRRLSDIRRRQKAVERGTESLAAQMRKLAGQTPMMDPRMAAEAQRLAADMAQAGNEVEAGRVAQAYSRQSDAMRGLNELARDMMQLSGRLNEASAQMALQEYMKRLEQLARQQKMLNQQTQGQAEGQQQPGGSTGEGQPMPGADELGRLALEQAMIRQALQKMLSGKSAGKLADQLGGAPGEMQKVEDDLRGGAVTQQTLRTQRDILHKMLDAQRSLYSKDKQSKERKAEAPKPYEPPPRPPLLRPEHSRPAKVLRERRELQDPELPLDFEAATQEYLNKIGRP